MLKSKGERQDTGGTPISQTSRATALSIAGLQQKALICKGKHGFGKANTLAFRQIFGIDWCFRQAEKNLLSRSIDFGPQCFKNSGGMLSGPCALPVLICLMAENSSLMEKGAKREPSTLEAFQSLVHFCFTWRARALSASLNFPLSSSWGATELAVTWQCLGWELRPVRRL